MTRFRLLASLAPLAALAALALAPAAALAKPGDVACIWEKSPKAFTDRLISGYQADPDAMFKTLDDREFDPGIAACGLSSPLAGDQVKAMQGEMLRRISAGALAARYGVSEARLEAAWMALPPADRARAEADFTGGALTALPDSEKEWLRALTNGVMTKLGLPAAANVDTAIWITGRAYVKRYDK